MNGQKRKKGAKINGEKSPQIDSYFSKKDKKEGHERSVLNTVTNNMPVTPEKNDSLIKSPVFSKSKVENDVIDGTPNFALNKFRLKRKRKEIEAKKEDTQIISAKDIQIVDTSTSPIIKRRRYSREEKTEELKTPVKFPAEDEEDLLACLEDSPFSTTPTKITGTPEKFDSPPPQFGRHKVIEVAPCNGGKVITLMEDSTSSRVKTLTLKGSWVTTDIKVNDIVNVDAAWCGDSVQVDDRAGFVIVNPDVLVSGTTVVSALFCMRKAVLAEKFKGLEGGNRVMLVGTVVHELLQEVVKERKYTKVGILGLLDKIMVSHRTMSDILSLGLQEDDVKKEVEGFVGHIQYFVKKFLMGETVERPRTEETKKKSGQQREQWRGRIREICDIEENFWSPRLGLKGKIDLTVDTECGPERRTLPLEIKTGRPSYSLSHQGQVTLYCMMSGDRREEARAGLLLYLRSSDMTQVAAGHQERRALLQLRNQLVAWLGESELPEPVSHPSCQTCGLLTVCSSYQQMAGTVPQPPHPMAGLVPQAVSHLTASHLAWFSKWCGLLDLEAREGRGGPQLKDLWCLAVDERERRGQAYAGLRLSSVEDGVHSFTRDTAMDWRQGPAPGEMVVISSLTSLAVAQGVLKSVETNKLLVSLDKTLPADSLYHVDRMIYAAANSSCYQGLARMMDNSPAAKTLRDVIIDLEPPEFKAGLGRIVAEHGKVVLKGLNKVQQRAVLRSIMCQRYSLIRGMPGTGKTTTIVGLVRLLARLGQSVLVVAYTNSAVDTILDKLQEKGEKFLRIGRREKVRSSLVSHCSEVVASQCGTVSQLRAEYLSYNIVGSTCLAVSHPATTIRRFDWVVCDEASQALLPSVLSSLMLADRFILVGDHAQLAPTVQSCAARTGGLDQSLFSVLDTAQPGATVCLNLQYRMNSKIQELANHLTYQGDLHSGDQEVSQRVLRLQGLEDDWKGVCLSPDPDRAVMFVDTGKLAKEDKQSGGIFNAREGRLVKVLVSVLASKAVSEADIGVIAPYSAQVKFVKVSIDGDVVMS